LACDRSPKTFDWPEAKCGTLKTATLKTRALRAIELPFSPQAENMSVIFIALPIALLLGALAVAGFVTTVSEGQYDDLETPPQRMLCDDLEVRTSHDKQG
jgi:cbb3-type cytochrome oxidase maturation protein